jgi:heme-degrading monooxygenase HmoA
MFARISTYKMNPDSVADAEAKLQELMPKIMGMDGMVTFTNAVEADGNGVVVSVVESEEKSNANQEQVAQIWAEFSDYLTEPPVIGGYRVLAHESN